MGAPARRTVGRALVAAVGMLTVGLVVLVSLAGAVAEDTGSLPGSDPGGAARGPVASDQDPGPGAVAAGETGVIPDLPPAMAGLYQQAAATCPGLPWTVLAAIGTVESGNGQSNLPGVHSGANAAGAEGPMQFEPPTFAEYDEPIPPGGADPPSPYDPTDAVYAAARMLCADGARGGSDLSGAVFAYNHSEAYVSQVFAVAASLGGP